MKWYRDKFELCKVIGSVWGPAAGDLVIAILSGALWNKRVQFIRYFEKYSCFWIERYLLVFSHLHHYHGRSQLKKSGVEEPTEQNIILGRAQAGTAHILGRVDNQIPLGNDC